MSERLSLSPGSDQQEAIQGRRSLSGAHGANGEARRPAQPRALGVKAARSAVTRQEPGSIPAAPTSLAEHVIDGVLAIAGGTLSGGEHVQADKSEGESRTPASLPQRSVNARDSAGPILGAPPESAPDPKPPARIRDRSVFAEFHALSQECLSCGRGYPIAAHHLLPRAQGGGDVLANLVPLCSICHGVFHDGLPHHGDFGHVFTPEAVKASIARWLRSEAGEDARWYLTRKLGAEGSVAWAERTFGEAW